MRLGSIKNFVMAANSVFQISNPNVNRGAFILFEGVDRCGKSFIFYSQPIERNLQLHY